MSKWSEHDKLAKISAKSQSIGEFLDWLTHERGLLICENRQFSETRERLFSDEEYVARWEEIVPANIPIQTLLAEYFGIDQDKIEQEKRQMLDEIRAAYAKGEPDAS